MDSLLKSALVANGGGVRAAFTPLADDVSQVQPSSSPPCSPFRFPGEIHVALALCDPDLSDLAQCLPASLGDDVGGHWMFRDDEESIRCNLCKPINEPAKKEPKFFFCVIVSWRASLSLTSTLASTSSWRGRRAGSWRR